jgi:hypothetical protein
MAVVNEPVVAPGPTGPVFVLTRLRLRGLWSLVQFIWFYRRLSRTLDGVPGLIHVALLAEGPLTWHMLSVWQDRRSMYQWVGEPEHVHAIRQTYGKWTRESWSARWGLEAVSPTARQWRNAPKMEMLSSTE